MRTEFLTTRAELGALVAEASRVIRTDGGLPEWPFATDDGIVDFCYYGETWDHGMACILDHLANVHGDRAISGVQLQPESSALWEKFGAEPGFRIERERVLSDYREVVGEEPRPLLSIINHAQTFVLFGSSGQWAIWTDARWETTVIWARSSVPTWRTAVTQVPFVACSTAISDFLTPIGAGSRVTRAERAIFSSTFSRRSVEP